MEAIKVEHLSKSYQGKQALKDLNLSVEQGRVFGLLGANGAGKSTSIECILGTRKQDGGAVSVLGMNPRKDRKKLFQQVGVQFQEANYQNERKTFPSRYEYGYLCNCDAACCFDYFGLHLRKQACF